MPFFDLSSDDRAGLAGLLREDNWIVACLCADWCDVCKQYRPGFAALAAQHPDKLFLWIDIEDHADVVGDLDVDNFPTLLMQRGDQVAFYGPLLPDVQIAARMLAAYARMSPEALRAELASSPQRRAWQNATALLDALRTPAG
ncbi:MAG: thioredoxin family protein [Burkholderiaceae bacterium]